MESTYLIFGDEQLLKEEKLNQIKEAILKKEAEAVDCNVFYAKDANAREIIESAYTSPFMSKKRIIIVKDAEKLSSEDKEALVSYISNPSDSTVLILLADRIDRGNRLFEAVSSCGRVIQCERIFGSEIDSWIINRAKVYGKRFSHNTIENLKENLGNNLTELDNAISKLAIYLGPEREMITTNDIEDLIGKSVANTAFELMDAISEKNANKALCILSNLTKDSKKVYEIVGTLGWHFKNMLKAKKMLEGRFSQSQIGKELNIYPSRLGKFFNQVKNFKKEEITRGFEFILRTDEQLKTSGKKPALSLELLVIKLSLGI